MAQKEFTVDHLCRDPEIHTVWISEEHRIASFHPVEGYAVKIFSNYAFFISYLCLP